MTSYFSIRRCKDSVNYLFEANQDTSTEADFEFEDCIKTENNKEDYILPY